VLFTRSPLKGASSRLGSAEMRLIEKGHHDNLRRGGKRSTLPLEALEASGALNRSIFIARSGDFSVRLVGDWGH